MNGAALTSSNNIPSIGIMNQTNPPEVIVSGLHFQLTPSLLTFVHQKAARLYRHEERIIRVRVELDCEQKRPGYRWFVAKGHLSSYGPEMNASVSSDNCHQAIALLIDKLDRMLQRRAIFNKEKRNHPHPIDLGWDLPKAG